MISHMAFIFLISHEFGHASERKPDACVTGHVVIVVVALDVLVLDE